MESENRKPLFTKRLLLIVVAVILLVLIVFLLLKRCGNGGGNFKVDQINLTPTRVNLKIGEQQQIYANVYPSDANDSSVYWESEDPTIASVDQNGVVTGINNGITTITAKANDGGGAIGSTTVTVGDDLPELEQIQLNKSIYTVKVGSTVLIEATPVPSTAQLLDIKYSIRDTNIATVDSSGRIKGVKVGSTIVTITANEGKVQTTATVKVVANSSGGTTNPNTPSDAKIPVSAISLTATETCYKLKVGNSYTIETKILPNNATDKTLTWEVVSAEDASDAAKNKVAKTYASVSNTGVVKGLKAGNVKIKITAKSGVYSYFDIKVISSGNEGYCTINNNGSSSDGGENGSNPSGGGTKVAAPKSVDFKCGTSVYTEPCQYNVGILINLGDAKLGTNFDKFYTCLSKNGSDCTPNKASNTSAPAYESITETGTYVYCVQLELKGKKGSKVCSAKKEIKIEKSQTSVTINSPTITAISNNKTYSSGSWTNSVVDIVLGGAQWDEAFYHNGSKLATYKETISDEGIKTITYKICKESNPSICGNSKTIIIKIDKTAPTCGTITGEGSSSSWKKSRTINVTCSDSASGCEQAKYEKTWNGNYSITTGYVRLKDKVGNEKLCPVNIYVDPVSPKITCEVISESGNGVGVKVTASDAASGLANNPSVSTTIKNTQSYTAEDKAGNSVSCKITVTENTSYKNQQKRYSCTKPTWKSPKTTWVKSCSASNSSSSNTVLYTTCQYITDASVCVDNGQVAPCYMKNTYERKGCDAYSPTPDEIKYPEMCKNSNWDTNYYKFTCSKITANKIYRGKVSY